MNPNKNKHVAAVLNERLTLGQIVALESYFNSCENNDNQNAKTKSKKSKKSKKHKNKNKSKNKDDDVDMDDNEEDNDAVKDESEQKMQVSDPDGEIKPSFTKDYEAVVARTVSTCIQTIPVASYVLSSVFFCDVA